MNEIQVSTLPTKLRSFSDRARGVSYNGAAGQLIAEAMVLAEQAAQKIEKTGDEFKYFSDLAESEHNRLRESADSWRRVAEKLETEKQALLGAIKQWLEQ
jgi:hypothetical protein